MKAVNVAVVGATGAVGEAMIEILESRDFPVDKLFPLASSRSVGKSVQFRGKRHSVRIWPTLTFRRPPSPCFQPEGVSVRRSHPLPPRRAAW